MATRKRRHGGLTRSEYLDSDTLLAFRQVIRQETETTKTRRAWTDHLIVEILARTGLRAGELLQGEEHPGRYLRLRDINLDLKKPSIFVAEGKGQVARVVYIHPTLRDLIAEYMTKWLPGSNPDWPLVCSDRTPGVPLTTAALRLKCHTWQAMYERKTKTLLGARLHPHLFRHSAASDFLLKNGNDMGALLKLKEVLGHASLNTSMVYLHTVCQGDYAETMT